MNSLSAEVARHNARLEKLLALMRESGVENPFDILLYLPELRNVPVTFMNGETWTMTRISRKSWQHKERPNKIVEEFFLHFRDAAGKRTIYRTYFGGSLRKPQNAKRVLDLYEDELNREWWHRRTPAVILEAIEKHYQRRKSGKAEKEMPND